MSNDDKLDMKKIAIETETIRLDQFLKWAAIVGTGGQAKQVIGEGIVYVNKQPVTQRGRKLVLGDLVEIQEARYLVTGLDG